MCCIRQPRRLIKSRRLVPFTHTGTARLIEAFIRRHYPDVAVVRVHSTTNIFRCVFFGFCFLN